VWGPGLAGGNGAGEVLFEKVEGLEGEDGVSGFIEEIGGQDGKLMSDRVELGAGGGLVG
jgi:hypothetical protein